MEVYASNYAKATATNDGEFVTYAYTDIPDTPILKKSVSADAAERIGRVATLYALHRAI